MFIFFANTGVSEVILYTLTPLLVKNIPYWYPAARAAIAVYPSFSGKSHSPYSPVVTE